MTQVARPSGSTNLVVVVVESKHQTPLRARDEFTKVNGWTLHDESTWIGPCPSDESHRQHLKALVERFWQEAINQVAASGRAPTEHISHNYLAEYVFVDHDDPNDVEE